MTVIRFSNASLRDANRNIDIAAVAEAIRATQARIRTDPNISFLQAIESQLRGVRRTAAHIAEQLPDNAKQNFLIACGYGA